MDMAAGALFPLGLATGELAMGSRAKRRLALTIAAAAFALAALTFKPLYACDSKSCPSSPSNLDGVAANALPTYPEPTEQAASEPVKLKKFTKSQTRTARRTQPRKATLAQRARAGQIAAAKEAEEAPASAKTTTVTPRVANAKAELALADFPKFPDLKALDPKAPLAEVSEQPKLATTETQANPAEGAQVEMVSADEFNDLDRAAWEANQMPKLMKLTGSDSHAELRDDDSKWAQTSTIGKMFVAFGALLTLGSAIRMFIA
jgi:hypothetical protein